MSQYKSSKTSTSRKDKTRLSSILAALLFLLVIASVATRAMPHNADCMKNPFASGCRGISAKRSAEVERLLEWPNGASMKAPVEDLGKTSYHKALGGETSPLLNLLRQQQLMTESIQQLTNAANRVAYELAASERQTTAPRFDGE